MKVIFLDCDGVINCRATKAKCGEYMGIDGALVKKLKEIVDATDAAIILSSTWRLGYNREHQDLENHAKYLSNKLGKQHLRSVGMTPDLGRNGCLRGHEIREWLDKNDDVVEEWVVLDDEYFWDFEECGIMPHLVQPSDGLDDEDVQHAIKILNGELNTFEEKVDEQKEESKVKKKRTSKKQKVAEEVSMAPAEE